MKKIFITSGDIDGIGLEVSSKALNKIGPKEDIHFILCSSKKNDQSQYYNLLSKKFELNFTENFSELSLEKNKITILQSDDGPTYWVENIVKNYKSLNVSALVTAPLSKIESFKTHKIKGHTDLFRTYFKENLFMYFVGEHFNTLLLTDHLPLRDALDIISIELYQNCLNAVNTLNLENKNLALVGINPHAGERGLLGSEDDAIINKFINQYKKSQSQFQLTGPMPADTAFLKNNWDKYSIFICPFHDIGLSAFKTVHGLNDGIQVTLGLPFLRTSVDHGTASDIFNKDIANYGSMQMAIEYALNKGK